MTASLSNAPTPDPRRRTAARRPAPPTTVHGGRWVGIVLLATALAGAAAVVAVHGAATDDARPAPGDAGQVLAADARTFAGGTDGPELLPVRPLPTPVVSTTDAPTVSPTALPTPDATTAPVLPSPTGDIGTPTSTEAPILDESDPRWDCRTMGNLRCGNVVVNGTAYVLDFGTGTFVPAP